MVFFFLGFFFFRYEILKSELKKIFSKKNPVRKYIWFYVQGAVKRTKINLIAFPELFWPGVVGRSWGRPNPRLAPVLTPPRQKKAEIRVYSANPARVSLGAERRSQRPTKTRGKPRVMSKCEFWSILQERALHAIHAPWRFLVWLGN